MTFYGPMNDIFIYQCETNPPQYEQALKKNIVSFDLDLFFKVTEVKLEVKWPKFTP